MIAPRMWYKLPWAGKGYEPRKMRHGDQYEVADITQSRSGHAIYVHFRYVDDGYVPPVLRAVVP